MTALEERFSDAQTIVDGALDGEWHSIMSRFLDVHYEQTAIYTAVETVERSSHILSSRKPEAKSFRLTHSTTQRNDL